MDIETRLAVLERRTKWLAALVVVLGSGLMLGAAGGSVPKEIRARSFVLEGPGGRTLATWCYKPDADRPGDSMTMLMFYGADGRPHSGISCDDDGAAGVGVFGPADDVALLYVMPEGDPQVQVKDAKGKAVFTRP